MPATASRSQGERLVVADGARLDFEADRSHAVTVRAVKGALTIEERFVITLDDVAEETPESGGNGTGGGGGSGVGTTGHEGRAKGRAWARAATGCWSAARAGMS